MQEDSPLLQSHPAMTALPADSPERVKHFKKFVIELLNGLKATDGTLFEIMRVARAYPTDVLVLACGKWRAVVMKDAGIAEDIMAKLCKMVEMQWLLETEYGSPEYVLCVGQCSTIIMDTLDSIPDPSRFPEVVGVFPAGAVYAMVTTHTEEFIHRFGKVFDVFTLPVSIQFWLVDTLRLMIRKNPNHVLQESIRRTIRSKTLKLKLL
jgi:hypothetical protein